MEFKQQIRKVIEEETEYCERGSGSEGANEGAKGGGSGRWGWDDGEGSGGASGGGGWRCHVVLHRLVY